MNKQAQLYAEKPHIPVQGITLSTENVSVRDRQEWLEDIIKQEYTKVKVMPPKGRDLFNAMTFYEWSRLRLSVIQSHEITIQRLLHEPYSANQNNYLAVVLLSGSYSLQQSGREVSLKPGDMAIYDATLPHKIECTTDFSKMIVAIPRAVMRERMGGVEHCTATRISGEQGVGNITSGFMRNMVSQLDILDAHTFEVLSDHYLDLLAESLASVRPQSIHLAKSKSAALHVVKNYIERHLADPTLNANQIALAVGLSARYINALFSREDTSMMRYVWSRRLENCKRDIQSDLHAGSNISEIAFRWGFNDSSHFSRAFKQRYGATPRDFLNAKI